MKQDNVDLYITPAQLIARIVGVSQYVSYKKQFVLNAYFRDFQVQDQSLQTEGIDIFWACTNLSSGDICTDSKDEPLILEQGDEKLIFKEYTFNPYTLIQIELTITKTTFDGQVEHKITSSDKTIVFISEMDIPPLEIVLEDDLIIDPTINLNQLIHAQMVYDPTYNPELLFYSGAIIYQNDVVEVFKFDYSKIRFQIWNYFTQGQLSETDIKIRFSVYNPEYILPSQLTLKFKLNFPPQNCLLTVQYDEDFSLASPYEISFENCEDEDKPIVYQFFYYSQQSDYQFEIENYQQIQRKQLNDISQSNKIIRNLPGGNILILAQAIDSRGAISNSTLSLNVKFYDYTPKAYISFVEEYIKQAEILNPEQQILNLSLLSQDILERETNLSTFKDQIDFPAIQKQLQEKKLFLIQQLQLSSKGILSTSYFNQLAKQSVYKIISSNINLEAQQQQDLLQIIQKDLENIANKCQTSDKSQQKYEMCLQDTYLNFKNIDSLSLISGNGDSQFNQQYIQLTQQIGSMLNVYAFPNENPQNFVGKNFIVKSQKITEKNLNSITGLSNQSNIFRILSHQQSKSNHLFQLPAKQRKLRVMSNTTFGEQNIYDTSSIIYDTNFYSQDNSFQSYTNLIQNMTKQKAVSFPVINPKIINTHTNSPFEAKEGVIHYFNNKNKIENLTCFAQQKNKEWGRSECLTRQNRKTHEMLCLCPDLTPTTIMEDINELFNQNKNLDSLFSDQGFKNLLAFQNFYKYLIFWVILIQTIVFLILIVYGKRLDQKYLFSSIPLSLSNNQKGINQSQQKIFPLQIQVKNFMNGYIQKNQKITEEDLEIKDQEETPVMLKQKAFDETNRLQKVLFYEKEEQSIKQTENESNFGDTNAHIQIRQNNQLSYRKRIFKQTSFFNQTNTNLQKQVSLQLQNELNSTQNVISVVSQKETPRTKIKDQQKGSDLDTRIFSFQKPTSLQIIDLVQIQNNNQKFNKYKMQSMADFSDLTNIYENNKKQRNSVKQEEEKKQSFLTKKLQFKRRNNKEIPIIIQNEISEEQKQKLSEINNLKYFIYFHELISVFLVFRHEISRATRFTLFYLRYEHTLAISIMFAVDKTLVQKIFISLFSSFSFIIFNIIIESLLTNRGLLRKAGIFITILIAGSYIYAILAIVSGEEPEKSNRFILTYIQFLVTDIVIVQSFTALVFGFFAKFIIKNSKSQDFFYRLFRLLKLNIIISTILK